MQGPRIQGVSIGVGLGVAPDDQASPVLRRIPMTMPFRLLLALTLLVTAFIGFTCDHPAVILAIRGVAVLVPMILSALICRTLMRDAETPLVRQFTAVFTAAFLWLGSFVGGFLLNHA